MKRYTLTLLSAYLFTTTLFASENQTAAPEHHYWQQDMQSLTPADKTAIQPTKHEIIKAMLDHSDKVSQKLATIMSNCAAAEKANIKIDVGFDPPLYDTDETFTVWHTWVAFQCNEPAQEVFYTCGLEFFMRDDTRNAIDKTFRYYGPC